MEIPEAQWIVAGTLLVFAVLIGVYVSFFFRNLAFGGSEEENHDLLTDFRKMHDDGHLDDGEFSKLKTLIPTGEQGVGLESKTEPMGPAEESGQKRFMTLQEAEARKAENGDTESSSDEPDSNESN